VAEKIKTVCLDDGADAGWLYIIKNASLFKIGSTTNPARRLSKDARTWLPDLELVGVKPFWNVRSLEGTLHCGLANFWYSGEWHQFPDETYDWLFDDFQKFHDEDRNKNSRDFHYWINGSGMAELIVEQNHRKISLRKWQREASVG
jgi:Meiotically up-regulated gene 113